MLWTKASLRLWTWELCLCQAFQKCFHKFSSYHTKYQMSRPLHRTGVQLTSLTAMVTLSVLPGAGWELWCWLGCPKYIKCAFFPRIFCMLLPLRLNRSLQKKSRVFIILFSVASHFHFIKEIAKIYKGKYCSGPFWLSFLTEWFNQINSLTRLPHL